MDCILKGFNLLIIIYIKICNCNKALNILNVSNFFSSFIYFYYNNLTLYYIPFNIQLVFDNLNKHNRFYLFVLSSILYFNQSNHIFY